MNKILGFFKKIIPSSIFKFFQPAYHYLLAVLGNIFFGSFSEEVFVVGVTGTKGKTTTVELINEILEKNGEKTALLSSVYKKIGDKREKKDSLNTMPGRWYIPKFLKKAVEAGCSYVILEVSSQGVEQFRHKFIDWNAAIFLNLHPEHIESHGSFEKYREAKVRFFESLKKSKAGTKYFLVNKDDENSLYFEEAVEDIPDSDKKVVRFSIDDIYKTVEEIKEKEEAPDWLYSEFNLENLAAAVSFSKLRGVQHQVIFDAVKNFEGLPGRLEFITKKPYSVVVDYAHTPDSLRGLYKNLRENYNMAEDGRLICVLGSAGGGRDKWKRPEMGKIAANYGDIVILTSEDPYQEDPMAIINDIKEGMNQTSEEPRRLVEEPDRRKAIELAIYEAKIGDVVAITGMGSQSWFHGKDGKIAWDEAGIAKEIFDKYNE
ncbi:MAG TPA: UDP-N-acetylmuramyl-tripeptide synthetase [Candidatus Paceibacterota bacterium]|nr:UDP-N-acetylmuramyl-tripeptide synthetase [Candidatus Paceibacterota bacterium]